MTADVETMFSAREIPWHRLGIVTAEALPMDEAIVQAGLDWKVRDYPVYAQVSDDPAYPRYELAVDRKAIVRDKDLKVLGVHGHGYQSFQNEDLFSFVEALLDTGDPLVYETAGALKGGKVVWATVKMPDEITINGDDHVPYLVLANSFDGSLAITGLLTMVRVVCSNTLSLAIRSAKASFRVRHTKTADKRVAQAREALGLTYKYIDGFGREVELLMEQHLNDAAFDGLLRHVFPITEGMTDRQVDAVDRRRNTVTQVYYEAPSIGRFRNTGWGALNAINEWEVWSARAMTTTMTRKAMAQKQMTRLLANDWPRTTEARRVLVAALS